MTGWWCARLVEAEHVLDQSNTEVKPSVTGLMTIVVPTWLWFRIVAAPAPPRSRPWHDLCHGHWCGRTIHVLLHLNGRHRKVGALVEGGQEGGQNFGVELGAAAARHLGADVIEV